MTSRPRGSGGKRNGSIIDAFDEMPAFCVKWFVVLDIRRISIAVMISVLEPANVL
jgi:hypothetical protein